MKVMISQPMAGKTDEEIVETREKAKAELEELGYEFINTLFTDEWYSKEAMAERGVHYNELDASSVRGTRWCDFKPIEEGDND